MSNGRKLCAACDGCGFTRAGDFANRSFPTCLVCGGSGQTYVEPAKVKHPVTFKAKPMADPVVFWTEDHRAVQFCSHLSSTE